MADLPDDGLIEADGDFDRKIKNGVEYNVQIHKAESGGTFGGGTITISEQAVLAPSQFLPIATDVPVTSNFTDVLKIRNGSTVRFTMAGSTSPKIQLSIIPLTNG